MKFGVITFPGSNCDRDLVYALRDRLGLETVELWHKDPDLRGCDAVFLPGGFSYGDYLRSGAIARFSPVMQSVVAFARKGGIVGGICNGFQILTEAGLLPGALRMNVSTRFICKTVALRPNADSAGFSALLEDREYRIPVAHKEGNYYCDDDQYARLRDNGQALFTYAGDNPNGSREAVAGICNEQGNVFGMMPHPERAVGAGNSDGLAIFEALLRRFN